MTRIFVERLWRSVKQDDVHLNGRTAMGELLIGLTKYFVYYHGQRLHQALGNQTPDEVYQSGVGSQETMEQEFNKSGQRCSAV